jgi:transcriptional regulator with XRE-family HTH domain
MTPIILAMTELITLRNRIGRNIRELRKTRCWSQEALGERADLSYKFIGEIERGLVNPSLDSLVKIADALGVEVAEFFLSDSIYVLSGNDLASVKSAVSVLNGVLCDIRLKP